MKWLITAFAPFNGAKTNSSLQVLSELKKLNLSDRLIFHGPVPVAFADTWNDVKKQIDLQPDLVGVLALGQAESRKKIGLERVALNWNDANIVDNDGYMPPQGKITDGPEAIWSNIPWENLTLSADVERSYSAGTFVCNALMFQLMSWAKLNQKRAGFIHIPLLESPMNQIAVKEMQRILEFVLKL